MHVRRAKNGTPSVHPIRGDGLCALRKLRRENPSEAYVFVTERGGPMSTIGFHHLIQRLGKAAKMPFPLHPHMLRHACGYKLANDGHDTRALQHYLGHKNIQHTVRYTELSPDRFRDFWRDYVIGASPAPGSDWHVQPSPTSLDVRRQMRPPGRGDFWILKITHAPSPKNLSKNGFCSRKGVAFLWKAFLQKKFQGREKFLMELMARDRLVGTL